MKPLAIKNANHFIPPVKLVNLIDIDVKSKSRRN